MVNGIIWVALGAALIPGTGNAAVYESLCPAVAQITSTKFKVGLVDMASPYNEGFTYSALGPEGKNWSGETSGTSDDYLAREFGLKLMKIDEQADSITCIYDGNVYHQKDEVITPYLKLHRQK